MSFPCYHTLNITAPTITIFHTPNLHITLPNLTLSYLILHLYLITTLQLNLTNLTKPYHLLESWTLFLNSDIFIVCSIWWKALFIVVVVIVYKFCCTKSRSSPFFKSCYQFPYCCWSTVYSFTKRRNKPGFSGLIKVPTWIPWIRHASLGWPARTYQQQLWVGTGFSLEYQLGAIG